MATPAVSALSKDWDRITARYEAQFAGQSRATRDLDELDDIIKVTRELVGRIDSIPEAVRPPDVSRIKQEASETLAMYQRERGLIVEAKKAGPQDQEFAMLATSANFTFARYFRHFAGQSRGTRDLGLISEMIDDLEGIAEAMDAIPSPSEGSRKDSELVHSTLEMYRTEKKEIESSRRTGTLEERGGRLATLANDQFKIYKDHFAGKGRATRRPALLGRMIEQLEAIQKEMKALKAEGLEGHNTANIDTVQKQLTTYRTELVEVRKARKEASFTDLMGMLGGAANELFEEYRKGYEGKDRKTRDLEQLTVICDGLSEIRRQMLDLSRAEASTMNEGNIDIVSSQLTMFEREYELIAETKRT